MGNRREMTTPDKTHCRCRVIGILGKSDAIRFRLLICIAAVMLTSGCAGWFRPPSRDQDASSLLAMMANQGAATRYLKAVGSLLVERQGQSRKVRVAVALGRPDRLRVELLSFIGQPLARIAARGDRLCYQEPGRRQGVKTIGRGGLKRLLGIDLSVEDLVSVLCGGLPEPELVKETFAQWGPEPGAVLLKSRWHRLRAKVFLSPNPWQPLAYERYTPEGGLCYRVSWLQWKSFNDRRLPCAWRFENGRGDRVLLRFRRIYLPASLPESMFNLIP